MRRVLFVVIAIFAACSPFATNSDLNPTPVPSTGDAAPINVGPFGVTADDGSTIDGSILPPPLTIPLGDGGCSDPRVTFRFQCADFESTAIDTGWAGFVPASNSGTAKLMNDNGAPSPAHFAEFTMPPPKPSAGCEYDRLYLDGDQPFTRLHFEYAMRIKTVGTVNGPANLSLLQLDPGAAADGTALFLQLTPEGASLDEQFTPRDAGSTVQNIQHDIPATLPAGVWLFVQEIVDVGLHAFSLIIETSTTRVATMTFPLEQLALGKRGQHFRTSVGLVCTTNNATVDYDDVVLFVTAPQ